MGFDGKKYINIIKEYKVLTYPIIILILLIFLLNIYVFFHLKKEEETAFNYLTILSTSISIIGSLASIIGLIIAYLQIKKESEKTVKKVESTLREISYLYSVSEMAKAVDKIRQVQSFIALEKFEAAHLRMLDIKDVILTIKHNRNMASFREELKKLPESERSLDKSATIFWSDLKIVSDQFSGTKKGRINSNKIRENLENLATILTHYEKLIMNRHGK